MRHLLLLTLLLAVGCDETRYSSTATATPGAPDRTDPRNPAPDDPDVPGSLVTLPAAALLDLEVTADGDPVVAYIDTDGRARLASMADDWAWKTDLPEGISAENDRNSHRFDLVMKDPTQAYVCHVLGGHAFLTSISGTEFPDEQRRLAEVSASLHGCRVDVGGEGQPWWAYSSRTHGFAEITVDQPDQGAWNIAGDEDPFGFGTRTLPFAMAVDDNGPVSLFTSEAGLWSRRIDRPVEELSRSNTAAEFHAVGLEIVRNGDHWAQVQRWNRPNVGYSTSIWRVDPDTLGGLGASHFITEQNVRHAGWGLTSRGVPLLVAVREGELTYHLDPDPHGDPPPRTPVAQVGDVRALASVVGPDDVLHIVYLHPEQDLLVRRSVDLSVP